MKPAPHAIISQGRDGKLAYDADERGNRVPDFSTCGYAGGDRKIPDAPVRVVVSPVNGDATARIQLAIDYIASLAPDSNGLRGAVLLLKGRYEVFGGLTITNSGVVLRGQGTENTHLIATDLDRRTLIRVSRPQDSSTNALVSIVGDVPSTQSTLLSLILAAFVRYCAQSGLPDRAHATGLTNFAPLILVAAWAAVGKPVRETLPGIVMSSPF